MPPLAKPKLIQLGRFQTWLLGLEFRLLVNHGDLLIARREVVRAREPIDAHARAPVERDVENIGAMFDRHGAFLFVRKDRVGLPATSADAARWAAGRGSSRNRPAR